MIAISSFRAFKDCPADWVKNQKRAKSSWDQVFSSIYLFGDEEPELCSPKTTFLKCFDRPSIRSMSEVCWRNSSDWACIVNGDIVVTQNILKIEHILKSVGVKCIVSKRYEIPENGGFINAKIVDNGVDFFGATKDVWAEVFHNIPVDFRIGRVKWDNWMVNFFMANHHDQCYDITPCRAIFHPKHEDRKDQNFDPPKDEYLNRHAWPMQIIEL